MNCIIVHGCPSSKERAMDPEQRTYDKHWLPWTKRELEKRGIKTDIPLMPEPWAPDYYKFKKEFEKYKVTEDTILIGHSCGCSFLVRWLGEAKQKIKQLVLVAPWKIANREDGSDKDFYGFQIDKSIKDRVGQITIFTSDNEEEEGKQSAKIFHSALDGNLIELKGKGHYCFNDLGTEEFPELIEEIIS